MAKFYGEIGYSETTEISPGVWGDTVVGKNYYGEIFKESHRWSTSKEVNDDFRINASVSILADAYAYKNVKHIKYVKYLGVKWKVVEITPEYPNITLTLGGEYIDQ